METSDNVKGIVQKEVSHLVQETLVAKQELYAGPLPHPDHLGQYKEVHPELPERIIRMAEDQAEHRRKLESAALKSNLRLEARGQIFGFVIAMTALLGGIYLIANDKPIWGAAIAISAVAGLTGLFIWVRRERKQEVKAKERASLTTGHPSEPPSPPRLPE